jgi:hypothetical protein
MGQIEVDEVYVAIDRVGRHFAVPVQAKGGKDKHAVIQTLQDVAFCERRFRDLICRPISVQFMASDLIAMFELTLHDGVVKVVEERHYRLVPASEITSADLNSYRVRGRE